LLIQDNHRKRKLVSHRGQSGSDYQCSTAKLLRHDAAGTYTVSEDSQGPPSQVVVGTHFCSSWTSSARFPSVQTRLHPQLPGIGRLTELVGV
jgi:hypothetical protein